MTPLDAARKLVNLRLHADFHDATALTDPVEAEAEQRDAYARLERAVRRSVGSPKQDLHALSDAVETSVPPEHRAALREAFSTYDNARSDHLTTVQHAAFWMGIAVGQALSERGARAITRDGGRP